jgi:hypothetical protein
MKYQIGFSIPKGKEWTYKTISTIFWKNCLCDTEYIMGLYRILFYSGFGLDRFQCTMINIRCLLSIKPRQTTYHLNT